MNAALLVERYLTTIGSDARAHGAASILQSWLTTLGLFPPDVEDLVPGDRLRWSPEHFRAVAEMLAWGRRAGFIDVDPFSADADTLESKRALSFAAVAELFVEYSRRHHKGGIKTAKWYADSLYKFRDRWPAVAIADLTPRHVNVWLDEKYSVKQVATRRGTVARIQAALGWAADEKLIPSNPLQGEKALRLKKMPKRKKVVANQEHEVLFSNIPDDNLRDFVVALYDSGARPGEVARVEGANIDWAASCWVLDEHKTDEDVDAPRRIFLSNRLLDVSRRLAARHPFGPIFRNSRGRAWTPNLVAQRVRAIRRRMKLDEKIVPYAYRHTFATELILAGKGYLTVAQLLGHVDGSMLAKHYAHVGQATEHLRDVVVDRGSKPETRSGALKIWS